MHICLDTSFIFKWQISSSLKRKEVRAQDFLALKAKKSSNILTLRPATSRTNTVLGPQAVWYICLCCSLLCFLCFLLRQVVSLFSCSSLQQLQAKLLPVQQVGFSAVPQKPQVNAQCTDMGKAPILALVFWDRGIEYSD